MAKLDQLPSPVMRCGTRFHANQAGWLFPEEWQHLGPPQLTPADNTALCINELRL
jgi:hypothetical protein